jgi:hypothetical protein
LTDLAVKLVGLGFSLLPGFMSFIENVGAPSSICRFQVETMVGWTPNRLAI